MKDFSLAADPTSSFQIGTVCYWDSDCSSLCCSRVCKDMEECKAARSYPRTFFQPCFQNEDCEANCCDTLHYTCSSEACNALGREWTVYIMAGMLSLVLGLLLFFSFKTYCKNRLLRGREGPPPSTTNEGGLYADDDTANKGGNFKVSPLISKSRLKWVPVDNLPLKNQVAEFLCESH